MTRIESGFEMSKVNGGETRNTLHCTFCGKPARGAQAHCRSDRVHLRRMRRALHGHRWRGEEVLAGEIARRHPDAEGDQKGRRYRLRGPQASATGIFAG